MTASEKITIEIDVNWGSDFQRQSAIGALKLCIQAWQTFYNERHQNNQITHRVVAVDKKEDL